MLLARLSCVSACRLFSSNVYKALPARFKLESLINTLFWKLVSRVAASNEKSLSVSKSYPSNVVSAVPSKLNSSNFPKVLFLNSLSWVQPSKNRETRLGRLWLLKAIRLEFSIRFN